MLTENPVHSHEYGFLGDLSRFQFYYPHSQCPLPNFPVVNSQRSFPSFLVAGVIALLAIAIVGFYWFFAKSPTNIVTSTSSSPSAAIFVSKVSPVMASLLVNPDQLQALDATGKLSGIKTSLFAKSGIDYRQDIQPWLGNEITLAVTNWDLDRDPENGQQPGYLMVLATKKPEKSREFVQLLFSKRVLAGGNLATEEYKGVKLLYEDPPPKQGALASALVGNEFVLFANDPKVLKDGINNVQAPDLNLTSSTQYQKALEKQPQNAFALAFLHLPTVAKWQGLELSASNYDSEIISLVLNPKGLLAETSFLGASAIIPPSLPLAQPVGALQYIPKSAGLAVAGANLSNLGDSELAKLWRQITGTIYGSEQEAIAKLAKPLIDLPKRWGINLGEDIFSWVKGEYALALLPQKQKTVSWVFAVEKLPEVKDGIDKLDAIATTKGLSISPISLDQQKVTAWTELTAASKPTDTQDKNALNVEAKVQGVHTTLDNYEIFTSDLGTMAQVLKTGEKSLINYPNFQDSIAAIPQPNQGYVYLDWIKSQQFLERQLPILKFVELLGKPFFDNLRSLTVSSYNSDTETFKSGIFFQLQP
jgi:hypothetical protein